MINLFASVAAASDLRFPAFSGRVVDEAKMLRPETERRIEAQLERLEAETGRRMVVATIADLQGREIEHYGYSLGRHWGIGRRQSEDGVMLLVAPRERRVRLEVGYGLETVLSDALAAQIIHEQMLPSFRGGGFQAGVTRGVDAIDAQLRLDSVLAEARAEAAVRPAAGIPTGPAILVTLVFLFVFLGALRATERRRLDIRRRGFGESAVKLWRGHPASDATPGGRRAARLGHDDDSFGGGGASGRW